MPSRKKTALFIRCTPEVAEKIREAAKVERRTLSEFVLNAVLYKNRDFHQPEDTFDEEMSNELAQTRGELQSLLSETLDLRPIFRLAHERYRRYSAASLARARSRIARSQDRLSRLAELRNKSNLVSTDSA
jgi:uncharacterized protein (DUF1778 family)